MSTPLTPTIINKKMQLRKVLSLLKGFGRYFRVEDKKSIFDSKIWPSIALIFLCKSPRKGSQKVKKNRFFQNEFSFNPNYYKWKYVTLEGCFASRRAGTVLLHRRQKIDFWLQNLALSSISCVKAQGRGLKKSKKSIFSKWVIFWPQLL